MSVMTGPLGTFVISWSQTEIDGLSGAPVTAVVRGATWLWHGQSVRIDVAAGIGNGAARQDAADGARRLVGQAMDEGQGRNDDGSLLDRTFTLTNGLKTWTATVLEVGSGAQPLLMFHGEMPPDATALFVLEGCAEQGHSHSVVTSSGGPGEGVVCFTPGTLLDTDQGHRPVEDLVAGDRVQTKDNGYRDILWIGSRDISGARLYAMPDLRPVRIRQGALGSERPTGDLVVSPDHRVLFRGDAASALWGEVEVLVAARDLIDDYGVHRDLRAKSVTYIHLLLSEHNVLFANGVETESFHPGVAALSEVAEDQRLRLYDVMPSLEFDMGEYGPMSRRVLTRAEAALLAA